MFQYIYCLDVQYVSIGELHQQQHNNMHHVWDLEQVFLTRTSNPFECALQTSQQNILFLLWPCVYDYTLIQYFVCSAALDLSALSCLGNSWK